MSGTPHIDDTVPARTVPPPSAPARSSAAEPARSGASPAPTPAVPAAGPVPATRPSARPQRGGRRLRVAAEASAERALYARIARWSRLLHALITYAVTGMVFLPATPGAGELHARVASTLVGGSIFLLAFRLERRNVAFARLSGFARFVYRARAVALGAVVFAATCFFIPELDPGAQQVGAAAAAIIVAGMVWNVFTRQLLGGRTVHRVLLVGDGERVSKFVHDFQLDPHPEYQIVGLLSDTSRAEVPEDEDDIGGDTTIDELIAMFDEHPRSGPGGTEDPNALGTLEDLETVLAAEAIDTVVVSVRRNRLELFSRLSSWQGGVTVQELPAFSEHVFGRVPVDVINAAWFMHMIHPFYRPYSRVVKRAGDLAAAIFISLLALPVAPLAALWIRIASPEAPVLFRQRRVGEGGREFTLVKFRTMRPGGDGSWTGERDPRIFRGGSFMRTTRIDELPNLWNILRGHMSFVGPRPEQPRYVTELEGAVPYYQRRHMVKPGLTGWAQVRQGYTDSVDGAADKLGYELYYLKHQSLFLDFVIFVETIRVVLMRFGSR